MAEIFVNKAVCKLPVIWYATLCIALCLLKFHTKLKDVLYIYAIQSWQTNILFLSFCTLSCMPCALRHSSRGT